MFVFHRVVFFLVCVCSIVLTKAQEIDTTLCVNPLPVLNSISNDHSVWIGMDGMLFTSDRNSGRPYKDPESGKCYEQVYHCDLFSKTIQKPKLRAQAIVFNNSAIAGQSDRRDIILVYSGFDGKGELRMYQLKPDSKKWKPRKMKMGRGMDDVSKTSAFYNANTGELYFCAQIESDTYGNGDIYVARQDSKGFWCDPINLGPMVNSSGDEESVFLSGDTLFFSSTGHRSEGQYDIYRSVKLNGQWTQAEILPFPVNSHKNELSYVSTPQGVYLASDREGGQGMLDLFFVSKKVVEIVIPDTVPQLIEVVIPDTPVVVILPEVKQDTFVNSFQEVRAEIEDEIIFYRVQLGAFRFIHDIPSYRKSFPQLDDESLLIEKELDLTKFLISNTFYEKDDDCYAKVTTLHKKVLTTYQILDSFIVAYTLNNKRIAIIWSFEEKKYKLLY